MKCKGKCEFIGFKNDRLHYRCKKCKKRCTKSKDGLIKKFPRIYKFCNGDLNKFVLLLRKGVYPYEYIDSWERFDETLLPDKGTFYSKLNLEDITDKDYEHAQKVWEVFETKSLGDYHELHVQRNILNRSKLISEPNYHTTKRFSENLLAIEMKKAKVKMNKPVYLDMSILDISKTFKYKFCYDYIKPKYEDRAKLCYIDTDSFIIHIVTEDFFVNISDDVERWFDTSNYDENDKRPLPIGMNKRVYGFFKDELGGKIMKEFVALRAKTYAYLMDDDGEEKKLKGTKKCVIKRELMFKNYKDCLLNGEVIIISQQRFKSDCHKVYTEEVNKIALSSNDDERLQLFDGTETYSYGTNVFKVCESEMMVLRNFIRYEICRLPLYGEIVLNSKDKCFQPINDQF